MCRCYSIFSDLIGTASCNHCSFWQWLHVVPLLLLSINSHENKQPCLNAIGKETTFDNSNSSPRFVWHVAVCYPTIFFLCLVLVSSSASKIPCSDPSSAFRASIQAEANSNITKKIILWCWSSCQILIIFSYWGHKYSCDANIRSQQSQNYAYFWAPVRGRTL